MKCKNFLMCLSVVVLFACGEGDDYRDVYVGTYNGDGYTGAIMVDVVGFTEDVTSGTGAIVVDKDKSDINRLNIQIGEDSYSAQINDDILTIEEREIDMESDDIHYTFQVFQSGSGTITAHDINLSFTYYGTATYEPDPNDPSQTRYYGINGSGYCSGIK